jgi:hypothetical protein
MAWVAGNVIISNGGWHPICHLSFNEFYRAIDGSKIALPASPGLLEYFGGMGPGCNVPTAQSSLLFDVYNHVIADAQIEPLNVDERSLAKLHIEKLLKFPDFDKELILLDRGYASEDLIKTFIKDDTLTLDEYRKLYFKRWGIETYFDILKNKFEIANFSGLTVNNIRQDY